MKKFAIAFAAVLLAVAGSSTVAQTPAPVVAPWCGELLPMITEAWIGSPHKRIQFVPKICNKILIDGQLETIPPAVSVVSGGVNTDVRNTCVDKVCGRALKPNMVYRTYVYKDAGALKINFSVTEHEEGPYGNEVNADDYAQSFVGLAATDENGYVCGGMNLCLLSWFYRGHTGLGNYFGAAYGKPIADVCSTTLVETSASVKVLTFGINATFRQGYSVPNFYATGTLTNSVPGMPSHAAIGIEWAGTPVTFGSNLVTWTHYQNANIGLNTAVSFSSDGTLPSGITAGTVYYVLPNDTDTFRLATTPNGTPITISGNGTGKHIVIVKNRQGGPRSAGGKTTEGLALPLSAVAIGAIGAEEGWLKATLMVSAPNGGCARPAEGMIYTSPHHS